MNLKKIFSPVFSKSKLAYLVIAFFVLSAAIFFSYRYTKVFKVDRSALVLIEKAENLFNEWESSNKASIDKSLLDEASSYLVQLDSLSTGRVLSARANFLKGLFLMKAYHQYDEALQSFSKVSSNTYQYNLSLLYQANIWEIKGDLKRALEKYKELSIVENPLYRVQGIFYQAIISEIIKENNIAQSLYSKIVKEYTGSTWQKLASNRLLYLSIFK